MPLLTSTDAETDGYDSTPAVWSEIAQAKTRNCAEKAGMGKGEKLQIISEPEAAATYSLDSMESVQSCTDMASCC